MNKFVKSLLSLFVLFVFCSNAFGATAEEVKQNIIRQSKSMGVEPAIMLSIAKVESGFNQNAKAGSNVGVFQLSTATAKTMGINPYDLDDNIKGGIIYYKNMYNKFGSMELAVAAYNTGAGAISRNGNTVPSYVRPFVNRIMSNYRQYKHEGL
ncbi:lytic transglycosylase domain-containing protein [bacterium]|nr:lytic transglycosylase domain-containing protein [bacterium]